MGESVTYGEAAAHIRSLSREIGSHYYMSRQDWAFPIDLAGIVAIMHAEVFINANRDPKKIPKPIELPRPWDGRKANSDVTPEERKRLTDKLKERSVFRDR